MIELFMAIDSAVDTKLGKLSGKGRNKNYRL